MSVINNVLKDLENRPTGFKPLDLGTVNHQNQPRFPLSFNWLVLPLLFVAIGSTYYVQRNIGAGDSATAATGFEQPQISPVVANETAPTKELAQPATAIVAEPAPSPPVQANQLVGLHINETPTFLEMSFQLTQSAQSFLKQRRQNRYVFLLRNSSSEISAPMIENPWLKNIQLQQNSQDVEIRLDTTRGVLVETLHQQKQDSHYWIIRLKKSIAAETAAPPSKLPGVTAEAKTAAKPDPAPEQVQKVTAASDPVATSAEINTVKLDIKPSSIELTDSERLKRAVGQIEAREWTAAEVGFKSLLDSEVDREARINLLSLYQLRQKPLEFERLLSLSMARYSQDQDMMLLDANQLFNSQQYSSLVQRYQDNAFNWQIPSLVAAAFQRLQQHDKAIEYYQRALKLNPRQPKNWISLAISQEQQADYGQALQSYQMAMRSGPLNDRLSDFVRQRIQQLDGKAL